VEKLRLQQINQPRWFFRWWVWIAFLLALGLAATPVLSGPPAQGQSYDSLRLFTEALFEISQKYVHPKSEEEMIYGSLRGMMNSLDPDSSFLTPQEYGNLQNRKKGAEAEAGLDLLIKDNLLTVASVIDGGPAAKAGLQPGDHIIKIDGQLVRNLTTQEATRRFRGVASANIKLQVLRNGLVKPLDLTVVLEPLGPGTVATEYLKDSLAYLRIRYFNDETHRELETALKNLKRHRPPVKGIILDLRNNARGNLDQAVRAGSMFLGDREIAAAKGRSFKSEETFEGKARDLVLKPLPPLVVLVDQGTGRAAEILAGALRDQSQATLLGAKTLGLCGLTRVLPLQDGSALVMTVAQCYTPKGQKIQGKGLEPEIAGKTPASPEEQKPAARPIPLEQDPWVLQAVDILTKGKPSQVAQKQD
jgi:carboxyl-terminal processing protease